jgi:hypothetical protein
MTDATLTYLDGRLRCLEVVSAALSGLHEASVIVGAGAARRLIAASIVDRLSLVASVAAEVLEAIDDCRANEIQIDVGVAMEILAGVTDRVKLTAESGRRDKAVDALVAARFAALSCRTTPEKKAA